MVLPCFTMSGTPGIGGAELSLLLPGSAVEGAGVISNAGLVAIRVPAQSNVVVTLATSDPADLAISTNAIILAGQSNAFFNLVLPDNAVADGTRHVTVWATAIGFSSVSNRLDILDNEVHHYRFSPITSCQTTNAAFAVTMYAEDVEGRLMSFFNRSVTITALALEGELPLAPTNAWVFSGGQCALTIRVTATGTGVRLRTQDAPGESDVFNVGLPFFNTVTQVVADVAWHEASETLWASVPATGGVYSNQLVSLDPASGLVTAAFPVGEDPGQIELSPDGAFLYVTLRNRSSLGRFNLETKQPGLAFSLGAATECGGFLRGGRRHRCGGGGCLGF